MKVLNTDVNTSSNTQLFEFTQGLDVDVHLYRQEIRIQKAWAQALARGGYLSSDECRRLVEELSQAQSLIEEGTFDWQITDEDIHMNLERYLTQTLGDLGKKIHQGRSRNDLIASTLRLYVNDQIDLLLPRMEKSIAAIKARSLAWLDVLTPGMTHMQFGQPLRYGHLFSAHGYSLRRDLTRLKRNKEEALEYLPLGSAAFAGTHLNLDLASLAQELGFRSPVLHSYDAVSDRDYMVGTLGSFSLIALHLSRFCEDLMFWSSSGIKVLKLPYDWSTGSSIMPNKRNPDVPELIRAKMARVMTASQEALVLMRSVTPSYGSDIHELKRTFMTACRELSTCFELLTPFVDGLDVDRTKAEALLNSGHILATDIANHLAETTSFRDAYKTVADSIREADGEKKQIHDHYQNGRRFTFEESVEARTLSGGTSLERAREAISRL